MPSNRLSGLNLLLLIITVVALAFGFYGFLRPLPRHDSTARETNARDVDSSAGIESDGGVRSATNGEPPSARHASKPAPEPERATPRPPDEPSPKPSISEPTDRGDAMISGVVLNAAGSPVPNATISARRSNLPLTPPPVESRDPDRSRAAVARYLEHIMSQTRTTTTNGEGRFSFVGLDAALAYDITALAPTGARGQLERVAANDSVTLILQPVFLLIGRVLGPQDEPVTQFTVKTYRQNAVWEAKQQAFTSADGRFELECAGGMLMVEVEAPGFFQGQPVEAQVEAGGAEHVFRLTQGAVLTGVVRDKQGNPVGNARVTTGSAEANYGGRRGGYYPGYNTAPETRTDSQGRYRFDSLGPREYSVTATYGESSDSKTLVLTVGSNVQDFTVEYGACLTITLKNGQGKPVEAEQVWFMTRNNQWHRGEKLPAREPGVSEYAGLKPDEYTVSISASGYPSVRKSIKLTSGANALAVELAEGAFVAGMLTSSNGSAVSGVSVRLVKEGENENDAWGAGRWAQVRADGSFKLGPVEPALWNIQVMTQDWKVVATEKRTLATGDNRVDLTVNAGGTLTVRITVEGGSVPQWSYVTLVSTGKGGSHAAYANQLGVATISFLEPGDYTLSVSAQGFAAPASSVTVRDGANNAAVVLRKPNCARITAVTPNSQAAKSGLQVGDLLLEYNGEKINTWEDVGRIRRKYSSNDDVTLTVERDGRQIIFSIKGGSIGIDGESAVR